MSAEVVSAIAAVVAAIVSILAIYVAGRSASAAENSAKAAVATLRRGAERELIGLCHEVVAENLRVIDLGGSLKSEYTALFNLSGASGGSRETTLQAGVDEDFAASENLSREAVSLADDLAKLHSASDDDVDQMSIRLMRALTRIRAIRESIQQQLAETRQEKRQRAKV